MTQTTDSKETIVEILDEKIKQMDRDIELNNLATKELIRMNRKLLSKKQTLLIKRKNYLQ